MLAASLLEFWEVKEVTGYFGVSGTSSRAAPVRPKARAAHISIEKRTEKRAINPDDLAKFWEIFWVQTGCLEKAAKGGRRGIRITPRSWGLDGGGRGAVT